MVQSSILTKKEKLGDHLEICSWPLSQQESQETASTVQSHENVLASGSCDCVPRRLIKNEELESCCQDSDGCPIVHCETEAIEAESATSTFTSGYS